MLKKNSKTLSWLEFEIFQGLNISHGSFLRCCPQRTSLNTSLDIGPKELALKNREKIKNQLSAHDIIYAKQIHSDEISIIEKKPTTPPSCDILITKTPNIALALQHADCQAALFYDPIKKIIAAVHAGWRGNVLKVYAKTVKILKEQYGSNPKDLLVGISPSLGPTNAEFIHYEKEFPLFMHPYQVTPFHFDLFQLARDELIDAGILNSHIEIASICTASDEKSYFSYRRDKLSGRHTTAILIKS